MKKSIVILTIYDRLVNGQGIYLEGTLSEFNISVPTYRRYIALLRSYLLEKHGKVVIYDKELKCYRLIE